MGHRLGTALVDGYSFGESARWAGGKSTVHPIRKDHAQESSHSLHLQNTVQHQLRTQRSKGQRDPGLEPEAIATEGHAAGEDTSQEAEEAGREEP